MLPTSPSDTPNYAQPSRRTTVKDQTKVGTNSTTQIDDEDQTGKPVRNMNCREPVDHSGPDLGCGDRTLHRLVETQRLASGLAIDRGRSHNDEVRAQAGL